MNPGPVTLFLAAPDPGASPATMVPAIAAMLADSGLAAECGARVDVVLAKTDPLDGNPLPLLSCPFAAAALIREPAPLALAAVADVLEHVEGIDPAASALVCGTEHAIKAGGGGIAVMMLVSRKPGLDRQAFLERWRSGHAPFGLRMSAPGYRQLHADAPPELAARFEGMPPFNRFDGAGIVHYRDRGEMAATRASPAVARDATADEMQFIDHGRSMLMMFEKTDPRRAAR